MSEFRSPPVTKNPDGIERRVGYEIEYAGVDMEEAASLLRDVVGGEIERGNPFHFDLRGSEFGDFVIEVDAQVLHEQTYESYLRSVGIDIDKLDLRGPVETLIGSLASIAVPQEIVTPPLPLSRMSLMEDIRAALVGAKARGTGDSVLYGFGVHINPDLPATSAASLLAHLRAYCLLFDWIVERDGVDWSRRIGPFIRRYPQEYVDLLMQTDYAPDRAQLAQDYVTHMPSRNYALDMLPVLVELEGESLLETVKQAELVKPRPAFHYRLPNCQIGDPAWRIANAWNDWVEVERLAADADRLEVVMQAYREHREAWLTPLVQSWSSIVADHVES